MTQEEFEERRKIIIKEMIRKFELYQLALDEINAKPVVIEIKEPIKLLGSQIGEIEWQIDKTKVVMKTWKNIYTYVVKDDDFFKKEI